MDNIFLSNSYTLFPPKSLFSITLIPISGADPGFCEDGFERGFVDSLKGTFEQK